MPIFVQIYPVAYLHCLAAYRRIQDLLGANYLLIGRELFIEFHRDLLRPLWEFELNWGKERLEFRLTGLLDLEAEIGEAVEEGREKEAELEALEALPLLPEERGGGGGAERGGEGEKSGSGEA